MDDGVAAGLFALVLGLPLILLSGLFVGVTSALALIALVASLALTFVVANWIATNQEIEGTDSTPSSDDQHASSASHSNEDDVSGALETIRERYARGDLSEREFERKTARLLETETPEDARRNAADQFAVDDHPADDSRDTNEGVSTDRDREYEVN